MTRQPLLRALFLTGLGAGAIACFGDATGPSHLDETGVGWATWVLPSRSAIRPPAPPPLTDPATVAELQEILALQAQITVAEQAAITKWDGPPAVAWNEEALRRLEFYWALLPDVQIATPVRAARAMALLNVAIYDALVAVWDAKYTYRRPAPSDLDSRVRAHVATGMRPSYPSEHAAAAAAAASVLSYVIANDPTGFEAMAREAGESRILAGAAFRGDVEAGWAIGQEVAARVIARAQGDGSSDAWNGSVPDGAQYWKPTPPRHVFPPFDPLAGTWRTWLLPSGNALRPPPHPLFGSPAFEADVDELRALNTSRTAAQADIARFWATGPPTSRWIDFMLDEIRVRRLSTLRSARALALASVAMHDAFVACWDAKYHYWLVRPITADPTIITVFSTPPFPSYPSGHSTISTAAAEVFAYLFPDAETRYHATAEEASFSRVWGAVHYRFDIVAGEELGREVGRMVVERGQAMIDNR